MFAFLDRAADVAWPNLGRGREAQAHEILERAEAILSDLVQDFMLCLGPRQRGPGQKESLKG